MLKTLTLKNVALIESAQIDFCQGLNVLSGETGAGKSVVLDAINFVLGAKAERTMIRRGASDCLVQASFSVYSNHNVKTLLENFDISFDGDIIITRKYDINGRGDIKVNGLSVTVGMLKEIASQLVDVHGQSEHFFLLKESNQLLSLDKYSQGVDDIKAQLKISTATLKKAYSEREKYLISNDERALQIDILKYQIDEIERANIQDGEEERLVLERKKYLAFEKIIAAFSAADSYLNEDSRAIDATNQALREIGGIQNFDKEYEGIYQTLCSAAAELSEASTAIKDVLENFEFDSQSAKKCESRLDEIKAIHKKYGNDTAAVASFLEKIKLEHQNLTDFERLSAQNSSQILQLEKKVFELCQELTKKRSQAANRFKSGVMDELHELNMKNAKFDVEFKEYNQTDVKFAGENGLDNISFTFSANKGEPLLALNKIISGGEMSRFMLAMKTQTTKTNEITTFVFDEIDAGISGDTALIVAQKFAKIALNFQIIAVSHLPQIVAMSDSLFLIKKTEDKDATFTNIQMLDRQGKQQELLRLLGASNQSQAAVTHAKDMVAMSDAFKNNLNRCN